MLRLTEASGVVHSANWTYGEWIGQTHCGYEFATPKNQWQRYTSEGLLIAAEAPYGGTRKMIVLGHVADVSCMTCIVRDST